MKQYITIDQLNELDEQQMIKIRDWYVVQDGDPIAYKMNSRQKYWYKDIVYNDPEYGYLWEPGSKLTRKWECPLLTIGQMIEFLKDNKKEVTIYDPVFDYDNNRWLVRTSGDDENNRNKNLCDALWESCKEVLNN